MLSLDEKVGQMLVVGFEGLRAPQYILNWLEDGKIGGVILFSRNIDTPEQVLALNRQLHSAAKRPLLIAIDQEGGVVARLRDGFSESPGAMALGAANSPKLAEKVSSVLGKEMRSIGINWNLAPVLDITNDIRNPSVGTRSLGTDPTSVSELGVAQVRGFQLMGVAATGKHFPGKAKTPIDPHIELPVIYDPIDDMWEKDLMPFRIAIKEGIASIMITHVQFKDLEPEYPSTLSRTIIGTLLRQKLGFKGLVTTDCMEMGAIKKNYGPGESAVLAAEAGANMILFSHTREYQEEAYESLKNAFSSGRIPKEKLNRSVDVIMRIKEKFSWSDPPPLDVIFSKEHQCIMNEAARLGTVLIKNDGIIPTMRKDISIVEFSLKSDANRSTSFLFEYLSNRCEKVDYLLLEAQDPSYDTSIRAFEMAKNSSFLVLATRNAHLIAKQEQASKKILENAKNSVLLCLRNPYDVGVLDARAIICTNGDSKPSISAAVDTIFGDINPRNKLPVNFF